MQPDQGSFALVVRCDASPMIGGGHLTRCRALALALRAQGKPVAFAVRSQSASAVAALEADDFPWMSVPVESPLGSADLKALIWAAHHGGAVGVLVDHYEARSDYFAGIRASGLLVAAIDDRADRDLTSVDWLLNQNLAAPDLDYRVSHRAEMLKGVDFALLRPEFGAARGRLMRSWAAEDRRVLVTFGAGDTADVAASVLTALDRIERRLEVRIVVGRDAPGLGPLQEESVRSRHDVQVLQSVQDMTAQMVWADLSINAGGSTCWELMCLGVPMVVTELSDDQRLNVAAIAEAGVGIQVQRDRLGAIDTEVSALLDDVDRRAEMSRRGMSLVDGHGALRSAISLAALLEERQTHAQR